MVEFDPDLTKKFEIHHCQKNIIELNDNGLMSKDSLISNTMKVSNEDMS